MRISEEIIIENPIIICLSFGGMVAAEIAKQINCKQLILLSSVKTGNELPFYYKLIGKLGLHRLIPAKLIKQSNFATQWFFGTESKEEKAMLKQILKDTDSNFLNWAINQILHWNNLIMPQNCIHIHGIYDRILPINSVEANHIISSGHFTVYTEANEIGKTLKDILDEN